MGTFGGALEARQIKASGGALRSEAEGEVETENGVLVLKRIHVRLLLSAEPHARQAAARVHGFFAAKCPVYLSLREAIRITTELVFEEAGSLEAAGL